MAPVDTAAFAVVTGRPTQSFSPIEWKESDPRIFMASGGAPVIFGPLTERRLLTPMSVIGPPAYGAAPRTRQIVTLGAYGLVVEWVRVPPLEGSVPFEPIVPGRIHPRWLRLTDADRERLARAAIPDGVR